MSAPIVVGVNGSPSSWRAVRWATEEAVRRHRPLRLVHACTLDLPGFSRHATGGSTYYERVLRQGRAYLRAAAGAVREVAPELTVLTDLREGPAEAVLISESASADMVVLGGVDTGRMSTLLVGSVPIALAAHARCPVVFVSPRSVDPPRPAGPVVVGVAGAPNDDAVLRFAFAAAADLGTGLVAVHSWRDADVAPLWAAPAWLVDWPGVRRTERRLVAERLAGWCQDYPDVDVRTTVVRGPAAVALTRAARRARLLVIGSRGRGDVAATLLGSVSRSVLHHASCPVAVVPVRSAHSPDLVRSANNDEGER